MALLHRGAGADATARVDEELRCQQKEGQGRLRQWAGEEVPVGVGAWFREMSTRVRAGVEGNVSSKATFL